MNKRIQKTLNVISRLKLSGLHFILLHILNKMKLLRGTASLKIRGIKHRIFLRSGTSDFKLFRNIFIDEEYDIPLPFTPRTIIDGGGNIGLAAILFANKYPNAKIVTIEPESSNFTILQKNISPYANITALKAGIWSKSSFLNITNPGSGKWAFIIEETNEPGQNSIKGISINDIITECGWKNADVIKLDIEGSEKEVFDNFGPWLNTAKAVIIETHDWIKANCSKAVEKAISNYNFKTSQKGENTVYIRTN